MGKYSEDRAWSDQWIPIIKQIVGPHLLGVSSFEDDVKHAADLVILRARDVNIACRVRRQFKREGTPTDYAKNYPNQFTIRSQRDNGAKTELEKITEGLGDWMFYGHESYGKIHPWWLIDLSAWRAHMIRRSRLIRRGQSSNGDGTHFAWFDLASFPDDPPILIAKAEEELAMVDIPF